MPFQLTEDHRQRLTRLLPFVVLGLVALCLLTQFILTLRQHHAQMRLYRALADAARQGRASVVFNAAHFNSTNSAEHGKPVVSTIPGESHPARADDAPQ